MRSDDTPTPTPTPTVDRPASSAADEAAFPNIQSGRYKFISVIGHGGAGTVYRALDSVLDKEVAIKKLHRASDDQVVRFQREAKIAGALKHENVMSVCDFGVTDHNEPYLVLDYVKGESLARHLRKFGKLRVDEALKIVLQIASGLAHAHRNGVIHRDIKPSNVMLVNKSPKSNRSQKSASEAGIGNRKAKIVDFGLAKSLNEEQNLTAAGAGLGTPKYMSPEHIHGLDVDERSDIYSLGCLFFELLTGSVPFEGDTAMETLELHLQEAPPTMASRGGKCSAELESIVENCLSKKPEDRIQSADRLIELVKKEIEEFEKERQNLELERQGEDQASSTNQQIKPNKKLILIGLACGFLVIAFAILFVNHFNQPQKQNSCADKTRRTVIVPEKILALPVEKPYSERIFVDEFRGENFGEAWSTSKVTDSDIEKFVADKSIDFSKIRILELTDPKITSAGYRLLANHVTLKDLTIEHHSIDKATIGNICNFKHLNDLKLVGSGEHFDPKSLFELQKLEELRTLNLGPYALNDVALQAISRLSRLSILELTGCTGFTPDGMRYLLTPKNLETLKLHSTDVDDESVAVLLPAMKLNMLGIRNTRTTDRLIDQLDKMVSLKGLDIRDCDKISEAAMSRLRRKKKGIDIRHGPLSAFNQYDE